MDDLVINDERYVSSKRAAQITGYAKDYIGQLCREGRVEARLVGRSWYVREAAIRDHRFGAENQTMETRISDGELSPPMAQESHYEPNFALEQEQDNFQPHEMSTATSMQEAWQEWFAKSREAEPAEPVILQKIPSTELNFEADVQQHEVVDNEAEPVAITAIYEERRVEQQEPVQTKQKEVDAQSHSYSGLRAVLIVLAVISGTVAVVSSGLIPLERAGIAASVVGYLNGTKIINK